MGCHQLAACTVSQQISAHRYQLRICSLVFLSGNPAIGSFAVVLSPSKWWCKARQKSSSALAMSDLSFRGNKWLSAPRTSLLQRPCPAYTKGAAATTTPLVLRRCWRWKTLPASREVCLISTHVLFISSFSSNTNFYPSKLFSHRLIYRVVSASF